MLPYKPHALRLDPIEVPTIDGVRRAPEWETGMLDFRGQITPSGSQAIFERFGLELSQPCLLLCDLEVGQLMKVGDTVAYGERRFAVKAAPMLWDAVSPTFTEVALEELSL